MVSESGLGFHLARQQPDEPAHALAQRSGQRSAIGSHLPARRRERRRLDSHCLCRFAKKTPIARVTAKATPSFEHNSHAIGQELTVFVPSATVGDPVKICRLRLRNDSRVAAPHRHLVRRVGARLGPRRSAVHVQTSRDEAIRRDCSPASTGPAASRAARLRRIQSEAPPVVFRRPRPVPGTQRFASKPAALEPHPPGQPHRRRTRSRAALQLAVTLDPGQQTEVIFLLGAGARRRSMRATSSPAITPRSRSNNALGRHTRAGGTTALGALQVRTPVLSVDFLLNRWLLYQSLSCRFWGRSALYQSGGAFGFRDQLQDSLAFLYAAPQSDARAHPGRGRPPVPRRRRPALVASGNRHGRPHPLLGRFALAALTSSRTTSKSPATRHSRRADSFPRRRRRSTPANRNRCSSPPVSVRHRSAVGTLPPRARSWLAASARTACR